jgi:hypothetical protein
MITSTMTNSDQGSLLALTGTLFLESGSIGRLGAQPARSIPHVLRLGFDAIDALVLLQLACFLLFWIQHDWHYLLWLSATCAITMFSIIAEPAAALEDQS